MSIQSIMVSYNGHEEEFSALDAAFQLAKRFQAHLSVWHISENPTELITKYSGSGYVGPFYDEAIIDALERPIEQAALLAKAQFKKLALKHGIKNHEQSKSGETSADFITARGDAPVILATKGRLADLIILTRPWDKSGRKISDILHYCLFNTGRPMLVVPPGKDEVRLNKKIAVAWDGSAQVTRTIALSMPLIRDSSVSIITAMSKGAKNFPLDPEEIANSIEQHHVHAETIWAEVKVSLEETILDSVKAVDATILLMGTYTKSRLSEVIFGGTTDYMLNNADCPILISH